MLAVLTAIAALSVTATPADAYNNSRITIRYTYVDTGTCAIDGGSGQVIKRSGGCEVNGIFFKKDVGGTAIQVRLYYPDKYNVLRLVTRVEFHPYGEHLKVCDTRNDSDTVYVRFKTSPDGGINWGSWSGRYSPPGTSKVVECADINFDLSEGKHIAFRIYDDKAMTDVIYQMFNGVA